MLYSDEYKAQAVATVRKGKPVRVVARDNSVPVGTLRDWIAEAETKAAPRREPSGTPGGAFYPFCSPSAAAYRSMISRRSSSMSSSCR